MSTTAKDPETLERDYQRRKAEIRIDESLSWEKKELKVRELGKRYDRERKLVELEEA